MEIDHQKVKRLFEIKKNQLKMVKRRGYDISKEEPLLSYNYENFINAYIPYAEKQKKSLRAVLSTVYKRAVNGESEGNDEGEKRLVVYFADTTNSKQQLGKETIEDVLEEMEKYKSKNAIIITAIPLSSSSKKKISELLTYNIYVFLENEMTYDPTEHFLVPEHRALSTDEQRAFLQKNNITIDQIPKMSTSDMISRYYGFKPGQVIEIKRTNLYDTIVQNSISYRVVENTD